MSAYGPRGSCVKPDLCLTVGRTVVHLQPLLLVWSLSQHFVFNRVEVEEAKQTRAFSRP